MKNYLVTGAAGFIGSHVARKLIKKGNKVWTIDDLSTGSISNLPDKINFIKGRCESKSTLLKIEKIDFEAILHIAGQSSGEISFTNPMNDLNRNTSSVLNLLSFSKKNNCKRFIYASSMSVYGKNNKNPINESAQCSPLSFYGVSKFASEKYLDIYCSLGMNCTSLRLFNVYGPNQNLKNLKQGMISIYLSQLKKRNKVYVKGSLNRFRDFIYIDDVVKIFINTIKNKKTFNKKINVGTGSKLTVRNLIKKIKKIRKNDFEIVEIKSTPGDQDGIFADNKMLKSLTGINKFIDIEKGLEKMINWISYSK